MGKPKPKMQGRTAAGGMHAFAAALAEQDASEPVAHIDSEQELEMLLAVPDGEQVCPSLSLPCRLAI